MIKIPQAQVGPKSILNVFASALHSASAASCFTSSPAPNLTALSLCKLMRERASSNVWTRLGSCVHLKSEVPGYSSQLGEQKRHEMPDFSDWRSGVMWPPLRASTDPSHTDCPSPPGNGCLKGSSTSVKMMVVPRVTVCSRKQGAGMN